VRGVPRQRRTDSHYDMNFLLANGPVCAFSALEMLVMAQVLGLDAAVSITMPASVLRRTTKGQRWFATYANQLVRRRG